MFSSKNPKISSVSVLYGLLVILCISKICIALPLALNNSQNPLASTVNYHLSSRSFLNNLVRKFNKPLLKTHGNKKLLKQRKYLLKIQKGKSVGRGILKMLLKTE